MHDMFRRLLLRLRISLPLWNERKRNHAPVAPLARPVHSGGAVSREGQDSRGLDDRREMEDRGVTHVYLHRFQQDKRGTFGLMTLSGRIPLCLTCEDPWNDNKNNISCIPEGVYQCRPHSGVKYKNVWWVEDVPKRTAILIHQGNTTKNTEGCILVGNKLGTVGGRPAVLNSVATLNMLRETLPDHFTLHVTNLQRDNLPPTMNA